MSRTLPLVVTALTVAGSAAAAADICVGGPRDSWMTQEQVAARVAELGYGDHVLAIEDGCIEVKVIANGKKIEIYMEPITGEVVKTKEG